VPDFNRRQRSATCKTCGGEVRFYPAPLHDDAAMVAEEETAGAWAHLDPRDWITNAHHPDPQEENNADEDHHRTN
jgi:hypothetical protein